MMDLQDFIEDGWEVEARATKGEWKYFAPDEHGDSATIETVDEFITETYASMGDVRFILYARKQVPKMLAALDALQQRYENATDSVGSEFDDGVAYGLSLAVSEIEQVLGDDFGE